MRLGTVFTFVLSACLFCSCAPVQQAQNDFLEQTGFKPSSAGEEFYETSRGSYRILFRPQMGDVWGRYAARMAMGEIGRESGRVGQFLTGSYDHVGTVVGSPLDRLLSRIIGQPLTFYLVLDHKKPNASRLDIVSVWSTVQPEVPMPKRHPVGFNAGSVYSNDAAFADRIAQDKALMDQIAELRSQYIWVDDKAVAFIFAGSERDWSAEIREHGGYAQLLNSIMGIMVGVADKI